MSDEPSSSRRHLGAGLRIAVSLLLLTLLILLIDVEQSAALLRDINPLFVPLLLLVNGSAFVLFALRWSWFCQRLGLIFPYRQFLGAIYQFQLACQVLPSSLLGEAARFAVFPKSVPRAQILKSIALDRLANQGSLLLLTALLAPIYWHTDLPTWTRPLLLVPPLVLVFALVSVQVARRTAAPDGFLRRHLGFLRLLLKDRRGLVPVFIGILVNLVVATEFLLAALAVRGSEQHPGAAGPLEQPLQLLMLVPFLTLVLTLLPISFAEWGTRELVALAVLGPTGLSAEEIVAISVLVGLTNLVSSLPGLILVARRRSLGG